MGRVPPVARRRGHRRWPALKFYGYSHCSVCETLVVFYPESCGEAKCRSCAHPPLDVRAPTDVQLPAFERSDVPSVEKNTTGRSHRYRPCPVCGGETWTEGNNRRSCLNGHVTGKKS